MQDFIQTQVKSPLRTPATTPHAFLPPSGYATAPDEAFSLALEATTGKRAGSEVVSSAGGGGDSSSMLVAEEAFLDIYLNGWTSCERTRNEKGRLVKKKVPRRVGRGRSSRSRGS